MSGRKKVNYRDEFRELKDRIQKGARRFKDDIPTMRGDRVKEAERDYQWAQDNRHKIKASSSNPEFVHSYYLHEGDLADLKEDLKNNPDAPDLRQRVQWKRQITDNYASAIKHRNPDWKPSDDEAEVIGKLVKGPKNIASARQHRKDTIRHHAETAAGASLMVGAGIGLHKLKKWADKTASVSSFDEFIKEANNCKYFIKE